MSPNTTILSGSSCAESNTAESNTAESNTAESNTAASGTAASGTAASGTAASDSAASDSASSGSAASATAASDTSARVIISAWKPVSLAAGMPRQTAFALPHFEKDTKAAAPSLRTFAISRTIGIPEDLFAAESAAARAAGYASGYAIGIEDARAATRDLLAAEAAAAEAAATARDSATQQAFEALFDAAAELEGLAVQSTTDIEEEIVSAAWAIATSIIGQVIADDNTRSQAAITRALSLAPSDEEVTVEVSPADFAVLAAADSDESHGAGHLGDAAPQTTDMTRIRRNRGRRTITIIADESLAPGDAVATCGATTIDARLSTAIERVRQVLAR
ncbi:MAG: FliH/SctL family protein [Nakamurella sp.]